jgi:signal transduction histidine kinase
MSEEVTNAGIHPLLLRQMRRSGVVIGDGATSAQLQTLLEKVSSSYRDAEQDRYLLERSLDLSSREMHYGIELERNRLNVIVSTTEDCICSLDADGCVTWANPAALKMLELHSVDATAFYFLSQIEPMPQTNSAIAGSVHNSRALLRTLGGRRVPIAYSRNGISGDSPSSVLAFRDITLDLAHEQELLSARETADSASKAKSQLLENIGHEVRTPLHGILGMVELFAESDLSADERSYLTNLRFSAENLLALLNNILEFSRGEDGSLELENIPFNLSALAEEVEQLLLPDAIAKGLSLRCTSSGPLFSLVEGDPTRLRQVLLNLMRNAVKFTRTGFVEIALLTALLPDRTLEVKFRVSDSGVGIHPDQHNAIFELFSQADNSTTRRFGGAGIGLAICAQIVRRMGSRISVVSTPGVGSDFAFTLRLKVHGRELQTLPSLSILYAEDNVINQLTAQKMLASKGHRVQIVPNGRAAVEAVKRCAFDLILMDNQMPELSGIEATRLLRELGYGLPIIAVTASTHPSDRQILLASGMNEFVAKPFTIHELECAMARALTVCNSPQPALLNTPE